MKKIEHRAGEVALKYGGSKRENRALCYVILVAYVFVLYSFGQRARYEIDGLIVPSGNSMTYVPFLFSLVAEAHRDLGWALDLIVTRSYNWLQAFLILLFSPILFNERSSLLIVNYLGFLVTILLIFKTALSSRVPQFWAFCIAMLFAAIPWNFQLRMEINLTEMRVDALFINSYLCAAVLLAWFIAYPSSKAVAVASGFALGAAIWTRWNAVVYVMMLVAGASLASLMRLAVVRARPSRAVLISCVIEALICLLMAAIYFGYMHHDIFLYGGEIAASISFNLKTRLAGAEWLLLNVPGLAISGRWFWPDINETPPYAIALTILGHAVVIYSAISGARRIRSPHQYEVLTAALGLIGATTFYSFMIFAFVTFGGYYARPEIRELHGVVPALAAVLCCAFSALSAQLSSGRLAAIGDLNRRSLYILVGVMAALSSSSLTGFSLNSFLDSSMSRLANVTYGPHRSTDKYHVPASVCGINDQSTRWYLPSEDLRSFILRFREAAAGKTAYFFWAGYFNNQIVDYYTAQADLSTIRMVPDRSPRDEQVWYATLRPTELTSEFMVSRVSQVRLCQGGLCHHTGTIVAMQSIWSSPIVAYYKDIASALNSPEIAPNYQVWGIVEENDTRVLVLKKEVHSVKDTGLESFPRTWGTPEQIIGRQFNGALLVSAKQRFPIDVNAEPRLMFAYEGYNVVRMGQTFVGVAWELGKVDIEAILKNAAPCPPTGQFIVAHDLDSLVETLAAASIKYPSDSKIPVLLHGYRSYNIVRVGRQFVGVSMALRQIDVAAVLANLVPRPPAGEFIVAPDLASLEARIRNECPILSIRYLKALGRQIRSTVLRALNSENAPEANKSGNGSG